MYVLQFVVRMKRCRSHFPFTSRLHRERSAASPHTLHTSRRFLRELKDGGALFGGVVLPSTAAKDRRVLSRYAKRKVSRSDEWTRHSDTEAFAALTDALNRTCKWFRLEPCGGMVMFCGYK